MKNKTVRTVTEWILIASVVLSVVFFIQFWNRSRTMRRLNTSLQKEAQYAQQMNNIMNMLMQETLEYSKRNPDIDPILESFGVKPSKNAPNRK